MLYSHSLSRKKTIDLFRFFFLFGIPPSSSTASSRRPPSSLILPHITLISINISLSQLVSTTFISINFSVSNFSVSTCHTSLYKLR